MFSWCFFGAGWFSGVMGILVGHPMDTIKIRSQTMPEKGIGQIIVNTFKLEGLRGFYKGFLAPMLTTGVTASIFFGVYGNTLRVLRNQYGHPEESHCDGVISYPLWYWDEFFSGAFAGAINTAVSAPVEAIKTRMQANAALDTNKYMMGNECSSTLSTIKFIQSKEGLPGFFRGGLALLLRDVPSYGVYTATYVLLFNSFKCSISSQYLACGLAGGFAGIISWAVVMPFDVVKSSLQSDNLSDPKYKGVFDCFRQNYRQHGLKIFMRGFSITVLRAFPVNYVTFVTYEEFKNHCL